MIYQVRHVTTYRYGSPVTFAHCTLTLIPRSGPGQTVENVSVSIVPKPMALTEHRSFFGHTVAVAQIDVPHTELRIEARSTVTVERTAPGGHDMFSEDMRWTDIRRLAATFPSLEPAAPAHFLFPSALVPFADEVTAYARESFTPERPVIEAGNDLMNRINQDFRYAPDATHVSTPLAEAFAKRHGVCQDYSHIMIAGLRGLGLPARYVSGYIRTMPPEGHPRLEGADATHAWIDLWCGPEQGWIGLDPTNAIPAANDHIVLATGRDYSDVVPVGGVLLGASEQDIVVNVDVLPIG